MRPLGAGTLMAVGYLFVGVIDDGGQAERLGVQPDWIRHFISIVTK